MLDMAVPPPPVGHRGIWQHKILLSLYELIHGKDYDMHGEEFTLNAVLDYFAEGQIFGAKLIDTGKAGELKMQEKYDEKIRALEALVLLSQERCAAVEKQMDDIAKDSIELKKTMKELNETILVKTSETQR